VGHSFFAISMVMQPTLLFDEIKFLPDSRLTDPVKVAASIEKRRAESFARKAAGLFKPIIVAIGHDDGTMAIFTGETPAAEAFAHIQATGRFASTVDYEDTVSDGLQFPRSIFVGESIVDRMATLAFTAMREGHKLSPIWFPRGFYDPCFVDPYHKFLRDADRAYISQTTFYANLNIPWPEVAHDEASAVVQATAAMAAARLMYGA
jgi:hypothetical protein